VERGRLANDGIAAVCITGDRDLVIPGNGDRELRTPDGTAAFRITGDAERALLGVVDSICIGKREDAGLACPRGLCVKTSGAATDGVGACRVFGGNLPLNAQDGMAFEGWAVGDMICKRGAALFCGIAAQDGIGAATYVPLL